LAIGVFNAYEVVAQLIRKAEKRIVVIDSYIDYSVLVQLSKRNLGVTVDINDGILQWHIVFGL
jgi:hypothetical protein